MNYYYQTVNFWFYEVCVLQCFNVKVLINTLTLKGYTIHLVKYLKNRVKKVRVNFQHRTAVLKKSHVNKLTYLKSIIC